MIINSQGKFWLVFKPKIYFYLLRECPIQCRRRLFPFRRHSARYQMYLACFKDCPIWNRNGIFRFRPLHSSPQFTSAYLKIWGVLTKFCGEIVEHGRSVQCHRQGCRSLHMDKSVLNSFLTSIFCYFMISLFRNVSFTYYKVENNNFQIFDPM